MAWVKAREMRFWSYLLYIWICGINRDIRTLRQDPPKAIVYCSLPETTYIGHEWRFNAGEKSQTRIMSEFLMQLVEEQQYACMGSFPVCEGYTIHVYVDPADTVLTNKN